jgi:hypothetical protein
LIVVRGFLISWISAEINWSGWSCFIFGGIEGINRFEDNG